MNTARMTLLAFPIVAGLAFAQDQPQAAPPAPPPASASHPAEMKTTTYRGELVDLACGGQQQTQAAPAAEAGNAANRAAGESSCPATEKTTQFGLKMSNGQVARFDLVGNQRAEEAFKTNKRWTKQATASKPLNVKVHGTMQGDKLIVSQIK